MRRAAEEGCRGGLLGELVRRSGERGYWIRRGLEGLGERRGINGKVVSKWLDGEEEKSKYNS